MAFRIVRKGSLAKRQQCARHSPTQQGSIITGWSLMQLAAFEQPINLKISLDFKPIWLRKNVLLLDRQSAAGGVTPVLHHWNTSLFSSSYSCAHLNYGIYRNLKFLGCKRGSKAGDLKVKHVGIAKFLYFSWLSTYLRSSFFKRRRKELNAAILANTLFYENLIPQILETFSFFPFSVRLRISSFLPPSPQNLPFSVWSVANLLYPFFLVSSAFFSKLNYNLTRYFFTWRESLVYFDTEAEVAATSYPFFYSTVFTSTRLSRLLVRCSQSGEPATHKAFELGNADFRGLVAEVEEGGGWGTFFSEGPAGLISFGVKNETLSWTPYRLYSRVLNRYSAPANSRVFITDRGGMVKILNLDINLLLRWFMRSSGTFELDKVTSAKFFLLNNYNYSNIVNPVWLLLKLLWIYALVFLCRPTWWLYFCTFSSYLVERIWAWIKFVPHLFAIRTVVWGILYKTVVKRGIIFDLIFYYYTVGRFFGTCVCSFLWAVSWYYRPRVSPTLSFRRPSQLRLFGLAVITGVGLFLLNNLNFLLLLVLIEGCWYFFYHRLVSLPNFSVSRLVDEVVALLRTNLHMFTYYMKRVTCRLLKFTWFALCIVASFLGLSAGRGVSRYFSLKRRSKVQLFDATTLRVGGLSNTNFGLTLIQLLLMVAAKRCYNSFAKLFNVSFFFDRIYSALVMSPIIIFWLYFSSFLNIFGAFGWWLRVTRTTHPNDLFGQAMYFSKLLQRPLIIGYRTLRRSVFVFNWDAVRAAVTEPFFIRNYLNWQYLQMFGLKTVSLSAKKMFSLQLTHVFSDLLGERLLGTMLSKTQLILFFYQIGLRFFYKGHQSFTQLHKLSPYSVIFFFIKITLLVIRLLVIMCSAILTFPLLVKFILVVWPLFGYFTLKFLWLYVLAAGSAIFYTKYRLF